MENFILIILCVSLGIIVRWRHIVKKDPHKGINVWLLYVALPALALRFIPEIKWSIEAIFPAIAPLVAWCGAIVFTNLYARKTKIDADTKLALLITSGLGNTAFLGFPMIAAYYGVENIRFAIIYDQVTFLFFSTVVITLIMNRKSGSKATLKEVLKKVFTFPTFVATLTAIVLTQIIHIDYSSIYPFLDKLVATLSPLALFSIGMQIRFKNFREEFRNISFGMLYKLIIAPTIILLLSLAFGNTGTLAKITVFETAMPTHVTASILAGEFDLNPKLCNLMVGCGILVGFITTAMWYFITAVVY